MPPRSSTPGASNGPRRPPSAARSGSGPPGGRRTAGGLPTAIRRRPTARRTARPRAPPAALDRLVEFLEWNQAHHKEVGGRLADLVKSTDHDRRAAAGLVDSLLEDSKRLLMLPFLTLFESMPRLVRDLSRAQGKEVDLVLRGGEVEIDKRILEEMKDPLVHLLRNAVDHGIEKPEARAQAGKARAGDDPGRRLPGGREQGRDPRFRRRRGRQPRGRPRRRRPAAGGLGRGGSRAGRAGVARARSSARRLDQPRPDRNLRPGAGHADREGEGREAGRGASRWSRGPGRARRSACCCR